ncbi:MULTISPECIES: inner membrane protein YbjM [Symbiopectobacterium]|uniref:inner membrane protein YbjM n=1 Tax=Symbiopectobacterium TaxID=801 RepID=UPI001A30083B|nr:MULTISPECIES: inner membrane protein YbjM [Symbiopectobacterium]MBG6247756.1 hypothetical protein [Candidatus Symbiopectobacterium sp. PLON1]MBT9429304.1 inner membrane protein YbjM [Candidatus Symbiopectobacterium endolongispinus]
MGSNKGGGCNLLFFLLFTVVFLSQKMDVFSTTETGFRGEPGMMLFLLPGIVASGLSARGRLRYPFLGELMAMPLCLIILHFWRTPMNAFWQELAYVMSAVFWSLMGALVFLFVYVSCQLYFR